MSDQTVVISDAIALARNLLNQNEILTAKVATLRLGRDQLRKECDSAKGARKAMSEDFQALQKKNEELRKMVDAEGVHLEMAEIEIDKLKAQVKRLKKSS